MSAQSFLIKAIENNGKPELINIDKSGSNSSAVQVYSRRALATKSKIKIRHASILIMSLSRTIASLNGEFSRDLASRTLNQPEEP